MSRRAGATTRSRIWTFDHDQQSSRRDVLATEEPLEIRLSAGSERRTIAITMRTPGADFELAAGFLYAEGVISQLDEIRKISFCVDALHGGEQHYNVVTVELVASTLPDIPSLERHFTTTSACGVCGKASLEALQTQRCPIMDPGPLVSTALIRRLPQALHDEQSGFVATGGLHAAALFDAAGTLLAVREDVGRHNALDKLIGWALMQRKLPLRQSLILVSGRASFELVQKCVMAEAPVICAISAPSSLAVDLARQFGMTLVGFIRGERFNVYAGIERIVSQTRQMVQERLAGYRQNQGRTIFVSLLDDDGSPLDQASAARRFQQVRLQAGPRDTVMGVQRTAAEISKKEA